MSRTCIVSCNKNIPLDNIFDNRNIESCLKINNRSIAMIYLTEKYTSTGWGFLCNNIIITASHIVSYMENCIVTTSKNKIKHVLDVSNIGFYDISILKLKNNIYSEDIIKYINDINYIDLKNIKKDMVLHSNKNSFTVINIEFRYLKSMLYPRIPLIICSINECIDNFNGLSGLFVHTDTSFTSPVVGMIVSSQNNKIEIIPFEIIKILITNYIDKSIQIFPLVVQNCKIISDDKIKHCLCVKNSSIHFTTDKKRKFTLNNGDIIETINNNSFIDGKILFNNLLVPFDTYILLNNGNITLSYFPKSSNTPTKIIIDPIYYNQDLFRILTTDNFIRCNCDGLIFAELNEQLIINCNKKNIILPSEIFNSYFKMFTNDRIIVLININSSSINIKKQFADQKIFINDRLNTLPILTRIGNKMIKHIEDIECTQSKLFTFLDFSLSEFKINI